MVRASFERTRQWRPPDRQPGQAVAGRNGRTPCLSEKVENGSGAIRKQAFFDRVGMVTNGILVTKIGAPFDPVHTWWQLAYDPTMADHVFSG